MNKVHKFDLDLVYSTKVLRYMYVYRCVCIFVVHNIQTLHLPSHGSRPSMFTVYVRVLIVRGWPTCFGTEANICPNCSFPHIIL